MGGEQTQKKGAGEVKDRALPKLPIRDEYKKRGNTFFSLLPRREQPTANDGCTTSPHGRASRPRTQPSTLLTRTHAHKVVRVIYGA